MLYTEYIGFTLKYQLFGINFTFGILGAGCIFVWTQIYAYPGPKVIKIFMLNSAEHKFFHAHKCYNANSCGPFNIRSRKIRILGLSEPGKS